MASLRFVLLFACAAASVAFVPSHAADKDTVMAVVNKAIADFNSGNKAGWSAACAPEAAIIDEFAPYFWQGAGACATWWSAYESTTKKDGISDSAVKIVTVRHADVTGDNAYIVLTSDISYKKDGKPATIEGASWTLALKKGAHGWKITAWSWAAK